MRARGRTIRRICHASRKARRSRSPSHPGDARQGQCDEDYPSYPCRGRAVRHWIHGLRTGRSGIEHGRRRVCKHCCRPRGRSNVGLAGQPAGDQVENRSLILRVFLPFVFGYYTAQVSENVYDTPTGKYLLIPQGARLIGLYDSQVAFGQSRVLLVWTRLLMPNGRSIVLERQPGTDTSGYSGLEDEVNNHWGVLFKAAVLSTLLSVGSEAGTSGNENNLVQAIRRGGSQSFNQVGQRVVSRNLDIQPTLTIRPGFPVRVIVSRDLMLAPYHQESAQ